MLNKVEYQGFGRRGWTGDYMDPFTYLYLYYSEHNESATGWWDPKFDKLIDEANNIVDEQKRFEKLAEAELIVAQAQITIPLGVPGTSWVKKPYVKGMYPNPGTLHSWKFVYIEQDPNKWDSDVDNIMQSHDPQVEAQLAALNKTQIDMANAQKAARGE
jgi:oligopeptide transport system substrate-binding protein